MAQLLAGSGYRPIDDPATGRGVDRQHLRLHRPGQGRIAASAARAGSPKAQRPAADRRRLPDPALRRRGGAAGAGHRRHPGHAPLDGYRRSGAAACAPASTRSRSTTCPRPPPWAATSRGVLRAAVQGASAYLKIADGCRRPCAFCAIPLIKGTAVSRPVEAILDEARLLAETHGSARDHPDRPGHHRLRPRPGDERWAGAPAWSG